MDTSMQWAQPIAPAEPAEMDVENTPVQASTEEPPPEEFQAAGPDDRMEQAPAAAQHSSMGYGSLRAPEAEAAEGRDAMQAVETHYEEQVHHPEALSADAAAATVDVPMPTVAQGTDHEQQGSEQGQGTPAHAPPPQLSPGQGLHQQDAPVHMEVDEAAPAGIAPFSPGEDGDQDQAEQPAAEDAHHRHDGAAVLHALPALDRPVQALSSEPIEAAAGRSVVPISEPNRALALADRPIQAPSSEPDQLVAERPVQAPSSEPNQAMHVTAPAADSPAPGSGPALEQQKVDSEQPCEGVREMPLAHVHTDGTSMDPMQGDGSVQEPAAGGMDSLKSHGAAPATASLASADPAATGTPRGVASGGRRHAEIKPETDAGAVVWAKTPRYPWWPAQVLSREDPWIPADMEAPRRGAVPVRFFGTYNFAWIESQRALGPWGDGVKDERAAKGKVKVFQDALNEAEHFLATGETPRGFKMGLVTEGGDAPEDGAGAGGSGGHPRNKPRDGKCVAKKDGKSSVLKRREADKAAAAARASAQRKLKAMRKLGLAPPRGSPYGGEPCLDATRSWVGVLQRALGEQAVQAEARASAAAAQMRAHEQQVLQHQQMQRKLQEQHVHQLYMEAQRRQHQLLQQQQAQQKQPQQGVQMLPSSLGPAHVPSRVATGMRPSPALQQQPMSSPAQASFVTRPVFALPAASVIQTGAPSQAAMKQIMLGMRPALAQTGQAPTPQPAGPGGPAPLPNRAVHAAALPNAAHSNLAHTLQQLRAMQPQHALSPQVPNVAPAFRPVPSVVSAAVPSGGHCAQQPEDQSSGAVQDAPKVAQSPSKPPPQLINS